MPAKVVLRSAWLVSLNCPHPEIYCTSSLKYLQNLACSWNSQLSSVLFVPRALQHDGEPNFMDHGIFKVSREQLNRAMDPSRGFVGDGAEFCLFGNFVAIAVVFGR